MDLGEEVVPGPVIEVLYVEHCPCVLAAQSLVRRVCAELGFDAEIRTVLIPDQAAAEQARFPVRRRCGWRAAMLSPGWSWPASTP
jgi:hypothetical protein